ncbi:class I SAM-dependent methyltransferase [Microbacter margulisiae]|uniref:tRNA (Cmo5U34)-methyltransferase n=1 Tax=Microbacter margulisiae TaxID=1350067 RepID=A0A7W5DSN6_9PORP|nr:class I SAM-dependent methyltransferase [Microbacter margulisiae]MBB3187513.1 tRNA (cmo5U34)-methyltransferase [Microbacter margulisiae]
MNKATVEEIRERFDHDVERFSNLDTGQVSTVDATLSLELITEAAKRINPKAVHLLDIGCGAGNYTLKMLSKLPDLNCTLVDLSAPMLERALERVSGATSGQVNTIQGDIREVDLPDNTYDIVLAGAVLHHLRDDNDWERTFARIYQMVAPGGCFMISDLIAQDTTVVDDYIREQYGDYLESYGGETYRNKVMDYIAKEDSPRSLNFQLELLKKTGFRETEILHKHLCFAAYGGIK